jgi:hypothetical protein
MENQRTLTDTMFIGRKIGLLIDHLQTGGEVQIDGRTWVWLDNHITRTTTDENGEKQDWGIDGLAIKGMSINGSTGEEKPHYMGQGSIPIQAFVQLVERLSEEDWLGICAGNALKSLNKKRG